MENQKEHNSEEEKSLDNTIDNFLAERNTESAAGEGSPEKTETLETEEPQERSPEDPKSENPAEETGFEGVPKGFSTHPAWIERNNKIKQLQADAEKYKQSANFAEELLGDPIVYKRYLERQGISQTRIDQLMRERGFEVKESAPKNENFEAFALEVCQEKGWSIQNLNQDQKAYIMDLISMAQTVTKKTIDPILKERLKPFEDYLSNSKNQQKMKTDYDKAKQDAMDEFKEDFASNPKYWEEVIEPAMHKYLDTLDQKDPKGDIKIDAVTLYERATRQILRERRSAKESQEARDQKKAFAKPLKPGAEVESHKSSKKGQTVTETIDSFLKDRGVRV